MTDAEFWEIERALWTGGAEAYRRRMAADCLMVFPDPAGILGGAEIVEAVAQAPRWATVDVADRRLRRHGEEAAVLAYRAEARRTEGEPWRALCSSTYVRLADGWRLVQHQQTPI